MQDYFRNPPSLLQGSNLATFEKKMALILETFVTIARSEKEAAASQRKKEESSATDVDNSYFFVKFLTNKKLLNLEVPFPSFADFYASIYPNTPKS